MYFSSVPLALSLLATTVLAVDKPADPELNAAIIDAPTELTKLDLIQDKLEYDFKAHPYFSYSPGGVVNANAATFPASTGEGLTMAWLALGPCAMLPPHYHPRATNFVVAVEGETQTWMIQENGAKTVTTTLTPGKMTIFPRASIHTMQNLGCGNATLISALNADDAGTTNLANGLFQLPPEMVQAAFGGKLSVDDQKALGGAIPAIGTGAALGSAECLAKCQMKS